jgi:hypothetical protein
MLCVAYCIRDSHSLNDSSPLYLRICCLVFSTQQILCWIVHEKRQTPSPGKTSTLELSNELGSRKREATLLQVCVGVVTVNGLTIGSVQGILYDHSQCVDVGSLLTDPLQRRIRFCNKLLDEASQEEADEISCL